jgi:hypothetical protein
MFKRILSCLLYAFLDYLDSEQPASHFCYQTAHGYGLSLHMPHCKCSTADCWLPAQFATRARARATLDDLKAAAARRLHAHKATAQPLELHATPPAERRASK